LKKTNSLPATFRIKHVLLFKSRHPYITINPTINEKSMKYIYIHYNLTQNLLQNNFYLEILLKPIKPMLAPIAPIERMKTATKSIVQVC